MPPDQTPDRRVVGAAWVHIGAFAVWVLTWIWAIVAAGGETRIVADTPREYVELGVLFASCSVVVASAVVGKLEAGGKRATFGPFMAAFAMTGILLPSAVRTVSGHRDRSG